MGVYWAEIADQNHTQIQTEFLKQQLNSSGWVLDLACGTARHTIALTKAGYCVVGVDVSFRLLEIAKQAGAAILVRCDLRFLPFKTGCFSAVFSMDTSIGYLPSEVDDSKVFSETKNVLSCGSLFIVDIFNQPHLASKYRNNAPPLTRDYPSFVLNQKRKVSPDGKRLTDNWIIKDKATGKTRVFRHTVHLYERNELETHLSAAKLRVESVWGSYEKEPYSSDSPRLILKTKKTCLDCDC